MMYYMLSDLTIIHRLVARCRPLSGIISGLLEGINVKTPLRILVTKNGYTRVSQLTPLHVMVQIRSYKQTNACLRYQEK